MFWKGRFDRVPAVPGVYAWFYPLRITSENLDALLQELQVVFSFDARLNGEAVHDLKTRIGWDDLALRLSMRPSNPAMPSDASTAWDKAVRDPEQFQRLRKVVLRGSLFMPPLYVGKTRSLAVRCGQHLAGTDNNDFHGRYETYAREHRLNAARVNDLLFACIATGAETDDSMEGILEEILKRACRPRYSYK